MTLCAWKEFVTCERPSNDLTARSNLERLSNSNVRFAGTRYTRGTWSLRWCRADPTRPDPAPTAGSDRLPERGAELGTCDSARPGGASCDLSDARDAPPTARIVACSIDNYRYPRMSNYLNYSELLLTFVRCLEQNVATVRGVPPPQQSVLSFYFCPVGLGCACVVSL
jgi:hypothetical protein